jgi:hypothetical protein
MVMVSPYEEKLPEKMCNVKSWAGFGQDRRSLNCPRARPMRAAAWKAVGEARHE